LRSARASMARGHLHRILPPPRRASAQKISAADSKELIAPSRSASSPKAAHRTASNGRAPLQGCARAQDRLAPDAKTCMRGSCTHGRNARTRWLAEFRSIARSRLLANAKPFDFIAVPRMRAALQGSSTMAMQSPRFSNLLAATPSASSLVSPGTCGALGSAGKIVGRRPLLQGDALNWLRERASFRRSRSGSNGSIISPGPHPPRTMSALARIGHSAPMTLLSFSMKISHELRPRRGAHSSSADLKRADASRACPRENKAANHSPNWLSWRVAPVPRVAAPCTSTRVCRPRHTRGSWGSGRDSRRSHCAQSAADHF